MDTNVDLTNIYQQKSPQTRLKYSLHYDEVPVVIDNGSYQFRAGFATDSEPFLQFKNVISKPKLKKDGIVVGDFIDDYSGQIRYSFDRNVVVNFEVQETVFDYAFDCLGLENMAEHSVVINEPLCNPNICRQQMNELLFEAYNVPSVSYYVDGLSSYGYNNPNYLESIANDTCLIISFGYQTIHLMPLFNGKLEAKLCRKINVGGSQLDSLMTRLIQLKYACHANNVDLRLGEILQQRFCKVAVDYRSEMFHWKSHSYNKENSIKIQIPYKKSDRLLTQDQIEERKKQQSSRGKEISNKRNQEKLISAQENLSNLMDILNTQSDCDTTLKSLGYSNQDDLMNEIKNLEQKIISLQNKIDGIEQPSKSNITMEERDKYDLIDVSDEELDEEELKLKQRQIMMKAATVRRQQIKLMKEIQRNKILNAVSKLEETRDEDFPLWVMNLRHRRQYLIDNRLKRRSSNVPSATVTTNNVSVCNSSTIGQSGSSNQNTSNTQSCSALIGGPSLDERRQQKVRKIRKLAAELHHDDEEFDQKTNKRQSSSSTNPTNGNTTTAMTSINQDEMSDDESDTEAKQLAQLEILLGQYDPEFTKDNNSNLKVELGEYYRLQLTTEPMRVPETIFHPYLIGLEDAGLSEVLEHLILGDYLAHLPTRSDGSQCITRSDTRQLAGNIFITGSLCNLPNLPERLFNDIRAILPSNEPDPVIKLASNPRLDAWRGASRLANHTQFDSMAMTKDIYNEMGHDYVIDHPFSNFYYSPLTDIIDAD